MGGIGVSIGIGSSIGISHRSSSLCLGGYRSSSYRDGVGMGGIGVSIGQHWSSYWYRLFMHIGLSFNIFMHIGFSSYFMSFYRLLMDIRISSRDVLILRSRCTKHCGCCGKENKEL